MAGPEMIGGVMVADNESPVSVILTEREWQLLVGIALLKAFDIKGLDASIETQLGTGVLLGNLGGVPGLLSIIESVAKQAGA